MQSSSNIKCRHCSREFSETEFILECQPDLKTTEMYSNALAAALTDDYAMEFRSCPTCAGGVCRVIKWEAGEHVRA